MKLHKVTKLQLQPPSEFPNKVLKIHTKTLNEKNSEICS